MLTIVFFEALFLSVAAGIISTVYMNVLPYERPFSCWWKFGNRYERKWFFKPIWVCEKCFAGQFCFWVYLVQCMHVSKSTIAGRIPWLPAFEMYFVGYSLIGHIFAVTGGIFFALIFTKILKLVINGK